MPRMNTGGGAAMNAWRAKGQLAKFITSSNFSALVNGPCALSIAGAAVGDVAIVITALIDSVTPTGWTKITQYTWALNGYHTQVFWKVLNSADITAGTVTFTNTSNNGGHCMCVVYRGCGTVAATGAVGNGLGTPLVLPGITKTANNRKLLSFVSDRDPAATFTTPANWNVVLPRFNSQFFTGIVAECVPNQYANGSNVNWVRVSSQEGVGQLLELLP